MNKKTNEDNLEKIEKEEADEQDTVSEDVEETIDWEKIAKEWEEKYKRALADYQNLEKRSHEQRREWIVSSNRELVLRILPVLDTLILAKQHSEDKSLDVSVKQFLDILKSEGVEKIETEGKDFDPHSMEAVATEDGEEGKVTSEVQTGYIMNDKLIRPALVKVGKKASS